MAISVPCTGCGSNLTVRDELLGKRIKCPKCGARFTAAQAASVQRQKDNAGTLTHRFHISGGVMAMIVAILLIPGGLLFWKLGPGKARAQFDEMLPKMDDNVKDVVDRSLQSYLSQHDRFNPRQPHMAPRTYLVNYKLGYMPITLPAKIPFQGLTSEGMMVGEYTSATGEINADVEIGGSSNPALLLRHGNTTIRVVGHIDGGNVVATVNGQPAEIKYPPTREEIDAEIEQLRAKKK
jgi:hypothetical protein